MYRCTSAMSSMPQSPPIFFIDCRLEFIASVAPNSSKAGVRMRRTEPSPRCWLQLLGRPLIRQNSLIRFGIGRGPNDFELRSNTRLRSHAIWRVHLHRSRIATTRTPSANFHTRNVASDPRDTPSSAAVGPHERRPYRCLPAEHRLARPSRHE